MRKDISLQFGDASLEHLNNINIILGRNGAGKSRFLRALEGALASNPESYVRYVSPERAGTFRRDGNVLTNISHDPNWLRSVRSRNQADNFKAASATLLREAETLYLRRLASTPEIRGDLERNFEIDRLNKINILLANIYLEASNNDFEFKSITSDDVIPPDQISSGESESVSLATEILYFFDTIDTNKFNILLLDEPDVHLHPDLQARLGKLIISMLDEFSEHTEKIAVCIATHSAPLVCAVADSDYVSIGTKSFGVDKVELKPATKHLRKAAPFFGHPLSLSLSQDAALLLEGEDDERVWQQAARSSNGRLKVFPILSSSSSQQTALEDFCVGLLKSLYDDPVAFSLRDGDGVVDQSLVHNLPLRRYRLACYAIENVLVTDDCLSLLGVSWLTFCEKLQSWLTENAGHRDVALIQELVNSQDRLRHKKIKGIRQLICAVAGSTKPWEVIAGQAIGTIDAGDLDGPSMLVDYLGKELVKEVIFRDL